MPRARAKDLHGDNVAAQRGKDGPDLLDPEDEGYAGTNEEPDGGARIPGVYDTGSVDDQDEGCQGTRLQNDSDMVRLGQRGP